MFVLVTVAISSFSCYREQRWGGFRHVGIRPPAERRSACTWRFFNGIFESVIAVSSQIYKEAFESSCTMRRGRFRSSNQNGRQQVAKEHKCRELEWRGFPRPLYRMRVQAPLLQHAQAIKEQNTGILSDIDTSLGERSFWRRTRVHSFFGPFIRCDSLRQIVGEVSSDSGCTGGVLVRNHPGVSRVSVRRYIEIRGFQIRIYSASRGNAINPYALSGMRPLFVLVSAVVLRICPCYCMSRPGGGMTRRNISPIRVGGTHRNRGCVDRASYEENGKREFCSQRR